MDIFISMSCAAIAVYRLHNVCGKLLTTIYFQPVTTATTAPTSIPIDICSATNLLLKVSHSHYSCMLLRLIVRKQSLYCHFIKWGLRYNYNDDLDEAVHTLHSHEIEPLIQIHSGKSKEVGKSHFHCSCAASSFPLCQ